MATVYVSGGGTALKDAILSGSSGDEFIVADGTYTHMDLRTMAISCSVRSENGPDNCVIAGRGRGAGVSLVDAQGIVGSLLFSGFRLEDTSSNGQAGPVTNSSNVTFHGCVLSDWGKMEINGDERYVACLFRNITFLTSPYRAKFYSCTFYGNTVASSQSYLLRQYCPSYNTVAWGNTKNGSAGTAVNCNLGDSDPLFVDAEAGDFHLKPGSPCIWAGSSSYLQSESDISGVRWNSPPSIGCYEYVYVPKPLPPYARRIEYLESDGAAYIDTGIDAQSELGIKTEIYALRPEASSVGTVFGARTAYHENSLLVWIGLAGDVQRMRFDYANSEQHVNNDDSNFSIVLNNNRGTINGISLDHTAASFNSHIPIHIFGLNNNGTHGAMLSAIKVKTFSISLNGTPVRSFVPCRVLDTGYLWDEVEGKFYGNSGTGDFVLGPDVREGVVPTRLNPFGIGRRQEEIRRVEYLESTGTQWIDTGVVAGTNTRSETDIDVAWGSNAGYLLSGCGGSRHVFGRWWTSSPRNTHLYVGLGDTNYDTGVLLSDLAGRHTYWIDAPLGKGGFDDTEFSISATVSENAFTSLLLAQRQSATTIRGSMNARLYGCRYYQSDILVRDFVPVAIGSTGYLLDRVSGRLFGNQGTGSFVLGPDIVPVEYVESTGVQWVDTGYVPKSSPRIVIDANWNVNANKNKEIFGLSDKATQWRLNCDGNKFYYAYFSTVSNTLCSGRVQLRAVYDCSGSVVVDGTTIITAAVGSAEANAKTVVLLTGNHDPGVVAKLYSATIYDNSTIVRSYVPVRVGTEGALYDRVTDTVFRSATSTPLVAGPETPA